MPFKCLNCARPLYNRRRKTCEFCGSPLSPEQQLSPSQTAAIDRMKANEAKQHRDHQRHSLPGTIGSDDIPFDFGG